MNIAIVCYPTFGGSGVVATELGVALARKGHQVHFITYSYPVRLDFLEMNIHFHEVHVEEYPLFHYQPYELALSSKMAYVVKTYNIDILHVHYAIPHAYAGYMAKQMLKREGIEVPMVTTLHGTDITLVGNHPTYKEAVTFSINESDVVTSVSESLKQDTLRLFNVHKDIKVIPNFINLKKPNEIIPCKRSVMAKPNELIVTHISNFRKVKRVDDGIVVTFDEKSGVTFEFNKADLTSEAKTLLTKMAGVLKEYPDTNVIVAGHTDSKGKPAYNMGLSERRAKAVTNFFTTSGLKASRFTTKWFGATQPAYDNSTEEGRAKNRRVNIAIVPNEKMKEDAKKQAQQ